MKSDETQFNVGSIYPAIGSARERQSGKYLCTGVQQLGADESSKKFWDSLGSGGLGVAQGEVGVEKTRTGGGSRVPRVLVVGDGMVDRYWVGTTDRVSPEAPIPVVKIDRTFDAPGGAANVLANLIVLGADATGIFSGSPRYIVKNRLMIGDVQVARWDENDRVEGLGAAPFTDPVTRYRYDAVVVADYGKGSITQETIDAIAKLGLPVYVDTKGDPTPWLGIANVLFPNEVEYTRYYDAYNKFKRIIIKCGAKGLKDYFPTAISLPHLHIWSYDFPARARFVRSVNGAGDTTIAAWVYATLVFKDRQSEFASAAAAVVVEKPYTSTASIKEIEDVLRRSV